MLASDAIAYARLILSSASGTNQRWSDGNLLTLVDRGVKYLVAAILFPESRMSTVATPNQQLYSLPDTHAIYRVYVNGQRATGVPGNIDTLEGTQILFNDSTGSGVPVSGSDAPPGAGGQMQPQWTVQTPVAYPFLNSWGSPAPNAQPFFSGQSPRFFRQGGSIGIVPAPSNAATITVDGVRIPDTLTATTQKIVVPDNFMEGIANFVLYRAFQSDKDEAAQMMSRNALGDCNAEIRKLRTWKRQYSLDDGQILPMTYRGRYRYGGHRYGDSGDGC